MQQLYHRYKCTYKIFQAKDKGLWMCHVVKSPTHVEKSPTRVEKPPTRVEKPQQWLK